MNDWDIEELVIEVAEHLEGYTPLVRPGHPVYLLGPADARLVVHPIWNQRGRIRVLGIYPDGSRGTLPDLRRHEITVTAARGAKFVAKRIERRLLPDYRRDLQACRERLATKATENGTRAEIVATLVELLPKASLTENARQTVVRWRLGGASGSFTVHGDITSTIEIHAADRELAERVAYAVQQRST
ncbi:hypothetical protein [Microbispora amethystogenes]|uniref:Uncharacterized protein n=1 Tax=Microbispora amethystogenes TaxID=1427754 RepID=A0ABQ4FN36_9ACTN|nr:hypothetical protein [Microbispora amethystogenes]GIH36221.1 hypothetical protein Mam01_63850 [Microbispora amethystogenes]